MIKRDGILAVTALEPEHNLRKGLELGLEFATRVRTPISDLAMINSGRRERTESTHQLSHRQRQRQPFTKLLARTVPGTLQSHSARSPSKLCVRGCLRR